MRDAEPASMMLAEILCSPFLTNEEARREAAARVALPGQQDSLRAARPQRRLDAIVGLAGKQTRGAGQLG
jgi:hypothetical protein